MRGHGAWETLSRLMVIIIRMEKEEVGRRAQPLFWSPQLRNLPDLSDFLFHSEACG